MEIKKDQIYSPNDLEKAQIAKKQTLAQWRHESRGPAYIKSGRRVLYRGDDVLTWIDGRRVRTHAD